LSKFSPLVCTAHTLAVIGHFKKPEMKHFVLILFLFFLIKPTYCQEREFVLRIDTLVLDSSRGFRLDISEHGNYIPSRTFLDTVYKKHITEYPNFIGRIKLPHDSSSILIQNANRGGVLMLRGAYNLETDTIVIDKLEIFQTCYNDSVITLVEYYKVKAGIRSDNPYKVKVKKKPIKNSCRENQPKMVTYKINGILYEIILDPPTGSAAKSMHFHGSKPRKYSRDPDNYKGEATRFSGWEKTFTYFSLIRIEL
jgi:hypothetical protein